jgi:thioredoxin-like negative regulator of GroEL
MQPDFRALASAGTDVNVAELDCTVHKQAAGHFQVRGYPTLKFFKDGIEIPYDATDRSLIAMKEFVTGMLPDYCSCIQ